MNDQTVHLCAALEQAIERVNVVDVRLFDMERPLRRPLRTSRGELAVRRATRIALTADVDGVEVPGVGEASPLAGWSTETLEHARYDLQRVADRVHARGGVSASELMSIVRPPSARFALSSALLDAAARAENLPLRRLLRPDAPHRVALNATIGIQPVDDTVAAAAAAVADGFGTLKLKIGRDLQRDLTSVARIREAHPNVAIRLDPNAAWSVDEAIDALARFAPYGIAYVEQPVAPDQMEDLGRVRAASQVLVAADESCFPSERAARIVDAGLVDVLVLKPSLFGAWGEVVGLVADARDADIGVVFTSAIDGAASRAVVAQMATVLLDSGTAHGLATGDRFEKGAETREDFVAAGELYLGSGSGIGRAAE